MVPKVVTIIKRMPLNPHGKVLKSELTKMALEALDAQLR
jgi:acyl-CoA synthetase (AMP-forming)/AMP-acid ligase II